MSDIRWFRKGDEPYEARIDVCVRVGDSINLSFSNVGKGFCGRIRLEARRGSQEQPGIWIWDEPREDLVKGGFTTLSREFVVFEGSWHDKGDPSPWTFYFESDLSA